MPLRRPRGRRREAGGAGSYLKNAKHDRGAAARPCGDGDDAHELDAELLAATAVERSVVHLRSLHGVRVFEEGLGGEQASRDDAPHAAEEVHRGGVQRVVDLEHLEAHRRAVVHGRGNHADEEGGVRLHHGARRGDGHQAGEDAVEGGRHVGRVAQRHVNDEREHATGAGGQCGGHRCALGDGHVHERQRRHRVEAVPAEPQDEGAQGRQHGGVAGHVHHGAVLAEAAAAGAQEDGAHKRRTTTAHVHHTGAREVDQAVATHHRLVLVPGRQPALAAPAPVHHHGVNEAGEDDGVDEVRLEVASLSHGALR